MFNVTQTSVNKQRHWMDLTLVRSNGAYVGVVLNRFIHEGMNHISNVKVHLKTRSGNVNILLIKCTVTENSQNIKPVQVAQVLYFVHFLEITRTRATFMNICNILIFMLSGSFVNISVKNNRYWLQNLVEYETKSDTYNGDWLLGSCI